MEKGMTKEKYIKYLKTLSNEKLMEEYDIQNSPFSIAISIDMNYDKAHLTHEELLHRLNHPKYLLHIINKSEGHIYREDGYSRNEG